MMIARQCGLKVWLEPRLREVKLGGWEGRLVAEIQTLYPREWAERELDPLHPIAPGGESLADVSDRVWASVAEIIQRHPHGSVLVVSHGLALAALRCRALGLPILEAHRLIPENAHPESIELP